MASRYTQEYFFQHTLMNVSFTDLNEIIHPQAEDIPEYIRHYASAVFVNGAFWNDSNRVLDEMKMEGHRSNYINLYVSYIDVQRTTYRLFIKGEFLCFYIYKNILDIYTYICTWITFYFLFLHMYIKIKKSLISILFFDFIK